MTSGVKKETEKQLRMSIWTISRIMRAGNTWSFERCDDSDKHYGETGDDFGDIIDKDNGTAGSRKEREGVDGQLMRMRMREEAVSGRMCVSCKD